METNKIWHDTHIIIIHPRKYDLEYKICEIYPSIDLYEMNNTEDHLGHGSKHILREQNIIFTH